MIVAFGAALLTPVALTSGVKVNAQSEPDIKSSLTCGGQVAPPGSTCTPVDDNASGGVQQIATDVINLLSWVVGVISVIMIIVGGFRYITSGGASDKVTGAKNTIIYAVIGLIIVALAQFIVNFVLAKTFDVAE